VYSNHNPINFNQLVFRDRVNLKLTMDIDKPVTGLDTETLNGYCRLICDDSGRSLICNRLEPILKFMTHVRFRNTHNFFFNLKYDAQAIVKYLDQEQLQQLYDEHKLAVGKYVIKYIPKKLFSITIHNHVHKFYDVAQFYETSLETAAQRYLGEGKELGGLDRARIGTDRRYWSRHRQAITKYCIVDAQLTKRLGDNLHRTFRDRLGIRPRAYVSKAGISKDYFRLNCEIPDIKNVPEWALAMAFNAYAGGRFEVPRKGYIGPGYNIDICSAYPGIMATLPDITQGEWRKVREPDADALLGYYQAVVYIPYMPLTPLPVKARSGLTIYPAGQFCTFLNKREYDTYKDIIDIKILHGVEFYAKEPVHPFKETIERLYELKRSIPKDNYEYSLNKITLNSAYGWQYEKIKQGDQYKVGKLFNPINATEITAGTRCQIWDVIVTDPKSVINIATDGIVMTRCPDLEWSKDLGQWGPPESGKITIIRSGVYRIDDEIKNRGLTKMEELETPHGAFKNVFDYIEQCPELTKYTVIRHRPLGLGECLAHYRIRSTKDINCFVDDPYTIDINRDFKRVWYDQFKNGGEILERSIGSDPVCLA